jgi:hypothetical protein
MIRRTAHAALTGMVVMLVACAGRGTAPALSPAPADAYAPCWAPDPAADQAEGHSDRCWRAVEAELLARSDGRAIRTEEGIVVRTEHGVEVMEDDTASADEFVRYRYGGYLPAVRLQILHDD